MSDEWISDAIARIRDEHRTANSFYVPVRRCDYYRCTCGHVMRWADEHADHYDAELLKAISQPTPRPPPEGAQRMTVGHAVIARVARQVLRERFASVDDQADALAAAVLGVLREDRDNQ
jgi:hypothetical protein